MAPGARWLHGPRDGELLRNLIAACYGSTYAYAHLYEPGVLEGLWRDGRLRSLGGGDDDGALTGHTGFWFKDPTGESVESGLSLVDPAQSGRSRFDYVSIWERLLRWLAQTTTFVHQCTTTLHPMAQLHALRHMYARPAGLVPFYTRNETVLGLNESGAPMHALCMTSILHADRVGAELVLPSGPWRSWLERIGCGLGLEPQDDPGSGTTSASSGLELLEDNHALGLRRRRLTSSVDAEALARGTAPIDLIHVAARPGVADRVAALRSLNYVPTGLRLRVAGPHEIVLQRIVDLPGVCEALADATLATTELRTLWADWQDACARTS